MPVISVMWRPRQEDLEFEANPDYIGTLPLKRVGRKSS